MLKIWNTFPPPACAYCWWRWKTWIDTGRTNRNLRRADCEKETPNHQFDHVDHCRHVCCMCSIRAKYRTNCLYWKYQIRGRTMAYLLCRICNCNGSLVRSVVLCEERKQLAFYSSLLRHRWIPVCREAAYIQFRGYHLCTGHTRSPLLPKLMERSMTLPLMDCQKNAVYSCAFTRKTLPIRLQAEEMEKIFYEQR